MTDAEADDDACSLFTARLTVGFIADEMLRNTAAKPLHIGFEMLAHGIAVVAEVPLEQARDLAMTFMRGLLDARIAEGAAANASNVVSLHQPSTTQGPHP